MTTNRLEELKRDIKLGNYNKAGKTLSKLKLEDLTMYNALSFMKLSLHVTYKLIQKYFN